MTDEDNDELKRIRKRYSPEVFRNVHMLSPFDMLRNLKNEMDMMERGFGNFIWDDEHPYRPLSHMHSLDFPHMEIFDEGDRLRIALEIPGSSKEDMEIEMEEDHFRIQARTKYEKCVENSFFVRCENRESTFVRELSLPVPVNPDEAKASYKNDVLEIVVSKKREEKKRTKVAIE
jgi:HSP20 family protein